MLVIDLIVGGVIVVGAICGWRLGAVRALPVAGFAAGVVLGSRLALLGGGLDSDYALLIALPGGLIAGGILAALAERRSASVGRLLGSSVLVIGFVGALLVGTSAAVAAWALAPAVSEVGSVRDDVQRSDVLERFNAVLTPAGPQRQEEAAPSDRPRSAPPPRSAASPLLAIPAVKRADRSLVKVVITRCGSGYQGSGWIAGHGIVVTNAHVVSASTKVSVQARGRGASLPATVVWFDGIHDLALLRVPLLGGSPGLQLASSVRPLIRGFSLGFRSGRKTIRRARLGPTTTKLRLPRMKLENDAGISLTMKDRLVTVIRGINGPGGSGGPMVDAHGRVLGTVFAGIPQNDITLAVPNRIVRSALQRANHRVSVPRCGAPPLTPTTKESIAAREA